MIYKIALDKGNWTYVAVDLDGTLMEPDMYPHYGKPTEGAKAAMERLKEKGWKIMVHTVRAGKGDEVIERIEDWLIENEIPFDIVVAKPMASYYVDDRGLNFDGDWDAIVNAIGDKKKKATQSIFKDTTGLEMFDVFVHDQPYLGGGGYKTVSEYFNKSKGMYGGVVFMSPDEYLSKIEKGYIQSEKMEALRKAVEKGEKLNIPWLEYREDGSLMNQEGRHRATLA